MLETKTNEETVIDVDRLNRKVHKVNLQSKSEDDSGDEFARQVEAHFLNEASDEVMQDIGTTTKTEQELVDESWAAFDAAIAQDPSAIPKAQPREIEYGIKMPESRKRKQDIPEDLADTGASRARFAIILDVSFDATSLPKHLQSQNLHYHIDARDATTIKNLFLTLWLENHEWLIHEGYNLERVQGVRRLEITLLMREGNSLKNTHCWSITGDFGGQEQGRAWKDFIEAAREWGHREALHQLGVTERRERLERLRCVEDHLGNLYDHTGNYVRQKKRPVHAQVDAEIVLHFE